MSETKKTVDKYQGSKPLQAISYKEKVRNDNEWGKKNGEYLIRAANFSNSNQDDYNNIVSWYKMYNNQINKEDFSYVTNPLNSKNEAFKSFPAKLRSYNIIRPNIDLLIGEWSKRPFKFDVINLDSDDVFNSFEETRYDQFKKNLTQRFVNTLNSFQVDTGMPNQDIPDPKTLLTELNTNYRDLKAIKGYKALKTLQFELGLKEHFKVCFKDWCISGKVRTLKMPKFSEIEYWRLSPIDVAHDKSINERNIEDGDWAVVRFRPNISEVIDLFYDELSQKQVKKLDEDENTYKNRLWLSMGGNVNENSDRANKVNLFFYTWKSRKKIGILSYIDPVTFEREEKEVDESYIPDKEAGEEVEWMWINETWEGWRLQDDTFLGIGPSISQRNELNNLSECKLSVNGRNFSDTESDNISLVGLGMPYQIMYIILMYRIELAIAKSKGKILVLDQNVIPDGAEEGEEKFLYYSEALGYMLIDRSQDGVDRSFNQYQEVNMDQYESIGKLIELANYFKSQYDELLGITRQRKGQNASSAGLGVTEQAIFRSTVISDIIFSDFDEFVQSELQGLLDNTRYAWVDGKKSYFQNDDGRLELFSLEAEDATNLSCGVYVDSLGQTSDKLQSLKEQIGAFAQRKDIKMSTIADIIFSDSYAEITAKLKQAEAIEMKMAGQQAANEKELLQMQEDLKKQYEEFTHMLEVDLMERQEDRLDNREYIKAQVEALKATGGDIDLVAIQKQADDRLNNLSKERLEREKMAQKDRIEKMKDMTKRMQISASLKNKVAGEK
jgi:hypothetical protein